MAKRSVPRRKAKPSPSVRRPGRVASEPAPVVTLPPLAERHLLDLQMRAMEITEVLRLVDQNSASCAVSLAYRETANLADALDGVNIEKAMRAAAGKVQS